MADNSGFYLKVQPDRLVSASSDVEAKIRQLEQVFQAMDRTVSSASSYWEGEGVTAHIAAYRRKTEAVQTAFRRFRENVTDLQMMAGIYEEAEAAITDTAGLLPTDVIV